MESLPDVGDRGALLELLEGQVARLGLEIEASKARAAALTKDQRVVQNAIKALKRGDGLQPGLPNGHDAGAIRPVTHVSEH